jgi:hypothetical protein
LLISAARLPNKAHQQSKKGILFKEPNPYAGSRPRDIIEEEEEERGGGGERRRRRRRSSLIIACKRTT